jgi:hypothetical protein
MLRSLAPCPNRRCSSAVSGVVRCPGLPASSRARAFAARGPASARRELRQRRRLFFTRSSARTPRPARDLRARSLLPSVGIRSAGPCPAAGTGRAWRPRRRTGTRWRRSRHRRTQQRDFPPRRSAARCHPAGCGGGPVEEPLDGAVLALRTIVAASMVTAASRCVVCRPTPKTSQHVGFTAVQPAQRRIQRDGSSAWRSSNVTTAPSRSPGGMAPSDAAAAAARHSPRRSDARGQPRGSDLPDRRTSAPRRTRDTRITRRILQRARDRRRLDRIHPVERPQRAQARPASPLVGRLAVNAATTDRPASVSSFGPPDRRRSARSTSRRWAVSRHHPPESDSMSTSCAGVVYASVFLGSRRVVSWTTR